MRCEMRKWDEESRMDETKVYAKEKSAGVVKKVKSPGGSKASASDDE